MSEELQDTFLTISESGKGLYKEKGSKFIAYTYPVKSEEEIKSQIQELKKKYYDARHHCYAYILGPNKDKYRANDDGEPGNSAGNPILGQIRSRKLTNVLIVVVRYFGGTKLGVSGLIHAYKTAASEALENTPIIEELVLDHMAIEFEYPQMNDVMKIVKDYNLEITHQQMNLKCNFQILVRQKFSEEVSTKLQKIQGLILSK